MIDPKKLLSYLFRVLIALAIIFVILAIPSMIAVSLAGVSYNQPIIPMCPTGARGDNLVRAFDNDGIVKSAALAIGLSDGSFIEMPSLTTPGIIHATLTDLSEATTKGEMLTARLNILDTSPAGTHQMRITFSNADRPVPQTAACVLTVQVAGAPSGDGGTRASITILSSEKIGDPQTANPYVQQLGPKVIGGLLPGAIAIVLAAALCAYFISALFGLQGLGKGLQFLRYRIFGRPGFSPFMIVEEGKFGMGSDEVKQLGGPAGLVLRQDSAIVTDTWGKLTRVVRGPGFPVLEPFEKIWDIIDLRPQRWPFKVSAVTRDGIPITYEVAVKFRIGDTDADILKAATCKWIRDAWRTEPDRLMDWVKRVMLSATEGTMRNAILAHYRLDELLDASVRRQIRADLLQLLAATAASDYGVLIMDVTLHDVEFGGQVLHEWYKTWKARRDLEVQKIEATERVQAIQMRKRAENQVRQEMLYRTIGTLKTLAKDGQDVPVDYVLFSFIDMIEHTAAAQKIFLPGDNLRRLEKIKEDLL